MNYETMWSVWYRDWSTRNGFSDAQIQKLRTLPFLITARPSQKPPRGSWRNWLLLGGRGAGKTRAGAEWTRFAVTHAGIGRIALVGPTLGDVREVMIEGPSGLKSIETIADWYPHYNVSRRRLSWPNGAIAQIFSAEDPDSLRGPQFEAAWCDEIAAWSYGQMVWDTLQMGLRLGRDPRCVATTTPRPVPLIRQLINQEQTIVTRSTTADNRSFLSPGFVDQMQAIYGKSHLARQELYGELIEQAEGALWLRSTLEACRRHRKPSKFEDIIVAIDPPATSGPQADRCGIIAAGTVDMAGFERRCFILADASVQGLRPMDWARQAADLARQVGASAIVAESNQGGEMVRSVLVSAGCRLPVRLVRARLGKRARAAPVAALYARGDVCHLGMFEALEDEMCRFGAEGFAQSPDRLDALVWAVTVLMLDSQGSPRLRRV